MTDTVTDPTTKSPEDTQPATAADTSVEGTRRVFRLSDLFSLTNLTRSAAHLAAGAVYRRRTERRDQEQDNLRRASRSKDKGAKEDRTLALRAVQGNLALTRDEVVVWFVIDPRTTSFRPHGAAENEMQQDALALAQLIGRRCYVRTSSRPHSVKQWAQDTWEDAKRHGDPLPGYAEFLMREQTHMERMDFAEKWVYLGVRLTGFRRYPTDTQREIDRLSPDIKELQYALESSSLGAKPAATADMEWLLRRSVALGLPCPRVEHVGDYDENTVGTLEARAEWYGEPMSKHITVTGQVPDAAQPATQKVSVLTLGRLNDQDIPRSEPTGWMQRTDRLAFPVEWSATFDVVPEDRTRRRMRGALDKISDQMEHYVSEHRMEPPRALARQKQLATDIQEQLDSNHGGLAIRTEGWYRVAVAAPTVDELNERVAKIRELYKNTAELVLTPNQYKTAREFIPGEPLSTGAYRRPMSVLALAAAVPQGTAEVGDRHGVYMGYTAGSALRAVAWAPHYDMESSTRDRSGLMVIAGELGSGKTFSFGSLVYRNVMQGDRAYVLDPSDQLGRLCDLPELAPHSRYVNLMKGRSGELNPYAVVSDPVAEHFEDETDYEREVSNARGTRTSLMQDILTQFLSHSLRNSEITESVINRVLVDVEPVPSSTSADVLHALEDIAGGKSNTDLSQDHRIRATDLLKIYQRLAQTPIGKLIFGEPEEATAEQRREAANKDVRLTVYTLNGIAIPTPDQIASGKLGETERLSVAIVQLAAWLVQSRIYQGDRHERKTLAIDEGKVLSAFSAGKTLITKSATDSRKHNTRFFLCSQNVTHFDFGDSEDSLGNLVGAALIGQTKSPQAVAAALQVLRAPRGEGYETILETLRPQRNRRDEAKSENELTGTDKARMAQAEKRHFIFSDGKNIERIVVDTDAHPHLKKALESRPSSTKTDNHTTPTTEVPQ